MERPLRKVLVLSDRKPGHYNQSFGIVKALDMLEPITMYKVELKFRIKILRSVLKYLLKRKWAKPIFQKQASLKLIPFFYKIDMKRILPEYDYIVSTGGDTSFLNAWITMAHSEVFSIYNGHPRGVRAQYFDVVTTVIDLDLPNQIILDVAPTVIEINQNKDIPKILQKFGLLSKHYFVLLIGGNGAGYTYTDEDIAKELNVDLKELYDMISEISTLSIASLDKIKELLKTCSFFNNKAKNIIKMAQDVENNFSGKVPHNTKDLMNLAGVGNKTANVFLIEADGANLMAVDTHVFRVSHRLGLSDGKTVEQTEAQLVKKLKDDLHIFHQAMVLFGRYHCKAVNPKCENCPLETVCKTNITFRV